jgi:hypothetical protein
VKKLLKLRLSRKNYSCRGVVFFLDFKNSIWMQPLVIRRMACKFFVFSALYVGNFQCVQAEIKPDFPLDYSLEPSFKNLGEWPPKDVDPEITKHPDEKQSEVEEKNVAQGFSANWSTDYPLSTSGGSGVGSQGAKGVSPTVQFSLKYNPLSYWFGQISFYKYLFSERQQSWNPDFTYSFGYDDWHTDTFSMVYSNYTGNRFRRDPANGGRYTAFNQGQWSFGYKFMLPQTLQQLFLVGDGDETGCNTNLGITPQFTDSETLLVKSYKKTISIGCRYTRPSGWYATITVLAYPGHSQQPWDPDFTYGFGYSDSSPGGISIQYSNYSANRFPGHNSLPGDGSLRKGGISVSWSPPW